MKRKVFNGLALFCSSCIKNNTCYKADKYNEMHFQDLDDDRKQNTQY